MLIYFDILDGTHVIFRQILILWSMIVYLVVFLLSSFPWQLDCNYFNTFKTS